MLARVAQTHNKFFSFLFCSFIRLYIFFKGKISGYPSLLFSNSLYLQRSSIVSAPRILQSSSCCLKMYVRYSWLIYFLPIYSWLSHWDFVVKALLENVDRCPLTPSIQKYPATKPLNCNSPLNSPKIKTQMRPKSEHQCYCEVICFIYVVLKAEN